MIRPITCIRGENIIAVVVIFRIVVFMCFVMIYVTSTKLLSVGVSM